MRRADAAAHVKLLERCQTTNLSRKREQAVAAQLQGNASATSESATATHIQPRQLRHGKYGSRNFDEGVVSQLTDGRRQSNNTTTRKRRT